MSAVAFAGVGLAAAGWEDVGLGVWLGAIGVQYVVGISVLVNRRKARHR